MAEDILSKLRTAVRDVPDFPKPGIIFKDITPILKDGAWFRESIEVFLQQCRGKKIDKIVGIDARGFLFGSARICSRDRFRPVAQERPAAVSDRKRAIFLEDAKRKWSCISTRLSAEKKLC